MLTPKDVEQDIRQLLQNERLAVLSTDQKGQPYASLVAFAGTSDLKTIVFCTPHTTRKFANLSANPRVALLINNGGNQPSDVYRAVAVTAIGRAAVSPPGDAPAPSSPKNVAQLYLQKHPHLEDFWRAASTALVAVRVERYFMVHNFQNVYDYRVIR